MSSRLLSNTYQMSTVLIFKCPVSSMLCLVCSTARGVRAGRTAPRSHPDRATRLLISHPTATRCDRITRARTTSELTYPAGEPVSYPSGYSSETLGPTSAAGRETTAVCGAARRRSSATHRSAVCRGFSCRTEHSELAPTRTGRCHAAPGRRTGKETERNREEDGERRRS